MSEQNEGAVDGGWGWEALGSEDDSAESADVNSQINQPTNQSCSKDEIHENQHSTSSNRLRKNVSEKSFSRKSSANMAGITSSPSFQELERAIGQTLALNCSSSDIYEMGTDGKIYSPNSGYHNMQSRYSSTNLTQQKVMSQRMRQQYQNQRGANFSQYRQHSYNNISVLGNTKMELAPFINESESRALIIFHLPSVPQVAIRDACAKFGVLYYIRPDFHSRGVTFISYFDLQAAIAAKSSIVEVLGNDIDASVHYSVMLHATNSNTEEYKLVLKNLPENVLESNVQSIFTRYGQLRSIQKTFGSSMNLSEASSNTPMAYTIEYFNIQDARLAASELSATSATLWGPDTAVTFAPLDERKQNLCKQLLATLSRWRSEVPMAPISPINVPVPPPIHFAPYQQIIPGMQIPPPSPIAGVNFNSNNRMHFGAFNGALNDNGMFAMAMPTPLQMVLPPGAPNLYTTGYSPHPLSTLNNPYNSHLMGTKVDSNGMIFNGMPMSPYVRPHYPNYSTTISMQGANEGHLMESNENRFNDANNIDMSYHSQQHAAAPRAMKMESNNYHGNNFSKRNKSSNQQAVSNNEGGMDSDFTLDLDRIREGRETRTTIMVRNIPNKYNQQMLLEEVNARHKGTYDFFYLPIDFKNRCNVGYCFINFLEPKFIAPFVEEFNRQRWRSFNSEKVCAISFARIQGKGAMISRFQNSSLLDKDEEYKPLLFCSSGPDKGKSEPFPVGTRVRQSFNSEGFTSPNSSNESHNGPNNNWQPNHMHHMINSAHQEGFVETSVSTSGAGTPSI